MVKKDLLNLKSSFLQGVLLSAIVAGTFLVPVAKAEIDDAMPSSIPKEILDDWNAQAKEKNETAASIKESLPAEYQAKCDGSFESACHWRRVYRMSEFPCLEKILFAKHHNLGAIAIGFWVNVGPSDVTDTDFKAEGSLCLLEFKNYYSQFTEILKKTNMCVKDPSISLDGKKVCFAMSPGKGQGYLLYEINLDDPSKVKQLTEYPSGIKVADFEPCYMPNGDIMFASTRCFGVIDCGWQPTSNIFMMDSAGKYIRRIGYDQVHTGYPTMCPDGKVLFARWEYNDRDVSNVMGIFSMNPDGCRQTEVYGNQTTWPMTMVQPRAVPGKPNLFFAVASGHHGSYSGEVFIADNSKATNGPQYIKMISPPRETKTRDNNDNFAFGGVYRNSAYPYPLSDEWYLVSYREENQLNSLSRMTNPGKFRIYLKSVDGKSRELLAWADQSLNTPVVVAPYKDIFGKEPFQIAKQVNYKDSMGVFTINDVYFGDGMKGVAKGAAKSIRVVALNYRVQGACDQGYADMVSGTPPSSVIFSAPTINPVSMAGCSWEAKRVLGEAKIFSDGSAAFKVPAREPVYFEVLDSNGCMIAGMRSWATLMPGETFACYGCHENKSEPPPTPPTFLAGDGDPQKLDTPMGIENKPFDYREMVEPIIQDKCASCHKSGHESGIDLTAGTSTYAKKTFAKSYMSLTKGLKPSDKAGVGVTASNKAICITSIYSQPPQMPPYSYGSTQSGMIKNLLKGHHDVKLTDKEFKILACWIDLEAPHSGKYDSYMSSSDAQKYKSLEATAQKWYDMEESNVTELAKLQTAVIPNDDYYDHMQPIPVSNSFSIGYMPKERALVLNNISSSQGNLILVDLNGKVVSRFNLSDLSKSKVTVTLPAALSNGIYLARFEGVNGVHSVKISITQ